MTNIELCHQLRDLKDTKKKLEDDLDTINASIKDTSDQILAIWTEAGINQQKLDGVGTFYLHKSFRASATNKELLFSYLKENGQGDMIKETVSPATLTAWAKDSGFDKDGLNQLGVGSYEQFDVRVRK